MTERQIKRLTVLGLNAADFQPAETDHDKLLRLEREITELRSFVNSIGKTELVGKGTAEDPFVWAVGIELIPNAYYTHEGVRYVWMGKAGTATADNPPVDNGGEWAEF